MSDRSDEITAAGSVLRKVTQPSVFPAIVALLAIVGYVVKDVYASKQQTEERAAVTKIQTEERAAFVNALDRNTAVIQKFTDMLSTHEREAALRYEAAVRTGSAKTGR